MDTYWLELVGHAHYCMCIHTLWESILHNTYFSFQNTLYEQVGGVAMGSLVSPIVANLYIEYFEREALCSASTPYVLVQVCG